MTTQTLQAFIFPVVLLAFLYFVLIRPQKKRDKQLKEMRESLKAGDAVVTIGGIVGKVASIKDDEVVIEVGADRTRMTIKKWAIASTSKMDKEESK